MPADGRGRVVLVTGASGFIGGHACTALERDGWRVRAAVRPGASPLPSGVDRAEVASLDDAERWRALCEGAELVVHAAGRAHVLRPSAGGEQVAFDDVNVAGTRVVVDAAVQAGVRHVVVLSSIAAIGAGRGAPLRETDAPAPADDYGRSKLAAERAAAEIATGSDVRLSIVRPPMVYGPDMKGNPLRLFDLIASGAPVPVGAVRNERSMLYVGNLAAAIVALARLQGPAIDTFHVADDELLSTAQLARLAARALGRPVRVPSVPAVLLRAAARAGDAIAPLVRAPLTTAVLDRLAGSLVLDTAHLAAVAGFRAPFTAEQGIAETARWYLHRAAA